MKNTDPLDQKIDELLASQPAKAPNDFADRTLAKVDADARHKKPGTLAPLIRFALPLAAAIALAFIVFNQSGSDESTPPAQITAHNTDNNEELSSYEVQELLMLQEGLSGFAQIESDELSSGELLNTLETLYSI